jgi:hypothetical protein
MDARSSVLAVGNGTEGSSSRVDLEGDRLDGGSDCLGGDGGSDESLGLDEGLGD